MSSKFFLAPLLFFVCILSGCNKNCCDFEPIIPCYSIPDKAVQELISPFPPLTLTERCTDWGKEMQLGKSFAREMDLYRALTCFKRAQFLIPFIHKERREENDYDIFMAYYLANKYDDAVKVFETTTLIRASITTFPALHELYVALYDAYMKTGHIDKALSLLQFIESQEPETAQNLRLETSVIDANVDSIYESAAGSILEENTNCFLQEFCEGVKSPQTARFLNAALPGAGYLYVGQKKTALTSFLINALFIAASYQFFQRGYIAAGIITTSLEMGWYFGGINGAGLAAKAYNESRYECLGRNFLIDNRLFPVLMITMGF